MKFQAVSLVYAIFNQLMNLPYCSEDLTVVRHKTQFWIHELSAAYRGQPSHPLAQDLQRILKLYPLELSDWVAILTAVEMRTDRLLLETREELEHYAERLYGSLYRLLATILVHPYNLDREQSWIKPLALAYTLFDFSLNSEKQLLRVNLPENIEKEVYTLFEPKGIPLKELRILARIAQAQAKQPMVHLGPLNILWLSIRERLSSRI